MKFTSFISEADRTGCVTLLRHLQRNPPKNTKVTINIRLSKAKYSCQEGFLLSGVKIRTCRAGRWKEKKNPKCSGALLSFCNETFPKCLCCPANVQALKLLVKRLVRTLIHDKGNVYLTKEILKSLNVNSVLLFLFVLVYLISLKWSPTLGKPHTP